MSHGSNESVLEIVKNKLLQTRAEADKAQAEVEQLRRQLIEELEKQKMPQQKLKFAQREAEEANTELTMIRQQITEERVARDKAERELAVLKQILADDTARRAQNDTLRNLYPRK